MPKYKVDTDQGSFMVELDQPPASAEELTGLVQGQLNKAQGDSPEKLTTDMQQFAQGPMAQEQARQAAEFTRLRQAPAVAEAKNFNQKSLGIAIPAAAALSAFVPGLQGIAAQSLIGGGATAANQLLGNEPPSAAQIGISAAVPAAAHGAVNLVKGAYGALGRAVAPAATRTAGGEAAIENLGATGNMIDRAFQVPGSKAAYRAAEAQGPLSAKSVADELKRSESATSKSMQARPARKVLRDTAENIYPKVEVPEIPAATNMADYLAGKAKAEQQLLDNLAKRPSGITWRNAIDEAQGLRNKAHEAFETGNNIAGDALRNAADSLVAKMEAINPNYAEANRFYLREQSINKIAEIMTKPQPSSKLGLLFQKDPMVKAAFDPKEAHMLEGVTRYLDTIGASASPYSGLGGRIADFMATPVAALVRSKPGMYLMKQIFKDGVTPEGMAVLAQFGRAYSAQGEQQ